MTDTPAGHFTATLEIHEVRMVSAPTPRGGWPGQGQAPDPRREVVEVVRLVIRADTLETLRGKIEAHAALL